MRMSQAASVIDPFLARVNREPDALALVFMADDGYDSDVTVSSLHAKASAWANALRTRDVGQGDIVIIALPYSLDLIAALLGSFYVRAIVSIFPYLVPQPDTATYIQQLRTLINNAQAQAIVVESGMTMELTQALADLSCRIIDEAQRESSKDFADYVIPTDGNQLAYLQYTSGTTGLQKGVLLTHRAILSQIAAFSQALAITPQDVVVSWLPLYHDFGLFAGLITPLLAGIPTVLMSPFKWLRRPHAFLWALDKYRGTLGFMPNSAFNHTAHIVRERDIEGLDLSCLRFLINAAEPILYRSQELFLDRFRPYGFREEALATGYGLAEITLSATVCSLGKRANVDWVKRQKLYETGQAIPTSADDSEAASFVSSGLPVSGVALAIVDERGQELPERHVGEIILRGESLFSGYHRRPDLTAQAIVEGWFHTGDLGYVANGELYVCGRKKDMMIIGGRNCYPEDLEAIANTIPGIYPDRVVAFGLMDERLGTEKAILVCELKHPTDETTRHQIEQELSRCVFQKLNLSLGEVHLVKKGWVVKTQNGKLARSANRRKYYGMDREG